MITTDVKQRTPEWYRARLGNFTGSKISALMGSSRTKSEIFSETAKSYIFAVMAERMLNPAIIENDELFQEYLDSKQVTSRAILWGQENEDYAKDAYLKAKGVEVGALLEVSSCTHDTLEHFAASPDGLIKLEGGEFRALEIKCPEEQTAVKYFCEIKDAATLKKTKPEYYWQIMAEMACTGAKDADFVVYQPRLTKPLHVVRIERNEEDIKAMEERVKLANDLITEKMATL